MKKKTNTNKFTETLTKLSDAKRKKISITNKNDIQTKNKSITDFISIDKNSFPANFDKTSNKNKKINENNENLIKDGNLRLSFKKEEKNDIFEEKTIFNEEVIDQTHIFLSPFLEILKSSIESITANDYPFLSIKVDEINKFFNKNISNFLVKFFLQSDKRFLFVPKTFQSEKFFEKEKIILFDGFDETKHISLKYDPIKCSEIINQKITKKFKKYLNKYKNDCRVDKGFLLFDKNDDFFTDFKIIEAICNDFHYKIIRIDELDKEKNKKLNKISEACQSQRIFTLKDSINDKTKLLQNVLSLPETIDSQSNYIDIIENQENSNHKNITNQTKACLQKQDTINKIESIKNMVENIRNIGSSQKNLILIYDKFINYEEDKTFFNTLSKLVSNSKCPVVVITNSLDKIPRDDLQLFFKYFSIFQIENENKKRIILNIAIIILLEVILKKELYHLLNDKNVTEFQCIVDSLSSKEDHFKMKFNKQFFDHYVQFIVQFCYLTHYSLDKMNFILKQMERFNLEFYFSSNFFECFLQRASEIFFNRCHLDNFSRMLINEEIYDIINPTDKKLNEYDGGNKEDILDSDRMASLKNFPEILENKSFLDTFEYKIKKVRNKESFNNEKDFYNKKLNLLAKNGKIQFTKNTEHIDCEESRIDILFSNELEYFSSICDILDSDINLFETTINHLVRERQCLFQMAFPSFLNRKTTYEMLGFLYHIIINLENEDFDKFLTKRQTRSYTRRLMKPQSLEITTENKINAILRYFIKKNVSFKQMKGLIFTYKFDSIYIKINDKYFLKNNNLNFFKDYKIDEEIENSNNLDELVSISSDDEIKKRKKR